MWEISDAAGLIAMPLTVLRRTSKAEDFGKLASLLREQGAEKLVIGHPLNTDGSVGPQARRVERYVAAMSEALEAEGLSVPIILWDEHGSTQRAQALMIEAGRSAKNRRQRIDAAAAAVILQDYLDEQQSF
jgi:putative Holliday junction resolvase